MKQAKILIVEDSGFFRKAMAHETPVIVLSGDMVERDVTEAKRLGINYYFQKDQSPIGKLVTVIRTTVRVPA
jgi:DNA-binding NarL/FixJ family response regulator